MKIYSLFIVSFFISALLFSCTTTSKSAGNDVANPYLSDIKSIMKTEWPKNRTINLVLHGHSVPSGYFKTPDVRPFEAYPLLTLKKIKQIYPYAVVNVILTSIGGENSIGGTKTV